MKTDINKEQMIYESYVVVNTLKERVDRHSMEHSQMFEKIWHKLEELQSDNRKNESEHRKMLETQGQRIFKLESERNLVVKILVPIISVIVSLLTGFFSKKFS